MQSVPWEMVHHVRFSRALTAGPIDTSRMQDEYALRYPGLWALRSNGGVNKSAKPSVLID